MKKFYTLAFILFAFFSFGQVTLPHYEGFNYTIGQSLHSQSGWTLLNSGDDLAITSGNLSYTDLPTSTANKVSFGGAGIDAAKSFTSQTANTVYYSLLLNVSDLSTTTSTSGGYCAGFIQGVTTNFGATLWLKKVDATKFNIGVNSRTTAANTVFSATDYSINQTYLVVISYTFNAATGDDVVKIWVNPALTGVEPAALASATNTGGLDLASVSQVLVRQGSATDTPTMDIDELRVALTWADVTSVILSVKQNSIAGLNIYPNPVSNGTLYITSASNNEKSIAVYDILGKEVLNTTTSNNTVNVSNLTRGAYIVKITEDGKTNSRKLIIE